MNTICKAMVDRILKDCEINTSDKFLIRKAKAVTFWHDQKHVATVILFSIGLYTNYGVYKNK